MSDSTPIELLPVPIELDSSEFVAICGWAFEDDYVGRLLKNDIPRRVLRGSCRVWVYENPDRQLVGFGTIDVCSDYSESYTGGRPHPYIPLLAVEPGMRGRGYGKSIVQHLIDLAALLALGPGGCHDVLFLDVYRDNDKAINLYERCGFGIVEREPRSDPDENGSTVLHHGQASVHCLSKTPSSARPGTSSRIWRGLGRSGPTTWSRPRPR